MEDYLDSSLFVSVIMPVYNGASFLYDSIGSILNQTHRDFELIIVNDGSTDNSHEIIESFSDARIKYLKFDANRGIVHALNTAITFASGSIIFRMDADDISLPKRLEVQIRYLLENPHVDIVGARVELFSFSKKSIVGYSDYIMDSSRVIELLLLLGSPYYHPTLAFRNFSDNSRKILYPEGFTHAEDYELFTSNFGNWKFGYINEVLLRYSIHESAHRLSSNKVKMKASTGASRLSYFKKIDPTVNSSLIQFYENLFYGDVLLNLNTCIKSVAFFNRVAFVYRNTSFNKAENDFLFKILRKAFFNVYYKFSPIGIHALIVYIKYSNRDLRFGFIDSGKFIIKCFIRV